VSKVYAKIYGITVVFKRLTKVFHVLLFPHFYAFPAQAAKVSKKLRVPWRRGALSCVAT
jgi:hypothetical protein